MTGTVGNFIATSLLTLTCSVILFVTYRVALRPILLRHNIIPLQNLQRTITDRFSSSGHIRLPSDEERENRNLEEGFRDDSDDEGGASGDDRVRREQPASE